MGHVSGVGCMYAPRAVRPIPIQFIPHGKVPMWKLVFLSTPKLPIFTGTNIEDHNGRPLVVILVDLDTASQSKLPGPLSIEVVPLRGDFPDYNRKDWTADEFEKVILRERAGKHPLLTGDVKLTMLNGRATAGKLQFTENSSWIGCRTFRIGARVVPGSYNGSRIVEAITEAFVVTDRRPKGFEKDYPLVLGDSVEKIGKLGGFHSKLKMNNIETVQDFVRMLMVKPDELRAILGKSMTDRVWKATTRHAKTCDPGNKVYAYSSAGGTIYVNSIFNLVKVEIGGNECPLQQLNRDQITLVLPLIMEAYEHRHNLQETHAVTLDSNATDNIALLRARFAAQAGGNTQGSRKQHGSQ